MSNLPAVGDSFAAEDTLCDVESVKAVSDVYAPVNGTVTEVNEILLDTPEAINKDPYGTWIAKIDRCFRPGRPFGCRRLYRRM